MATDNEIIEHEELVRRFMQHTSSVPYSKNWNYLITAYNKCLQVWSENNGFQQFSNCNNHIVEGEYTLAKFALRGALSPSLNNQLNINRALMMICDFIKWYNKYKVLNFSTSDFTATEADLLVQNQLS